MLGINIIASNQAQPTVVGALAGVANAAGGGAGEAVTTAVSFTDTYGNGQLPAAYAVAVTPSQACAWSVTGKTTSGFTVTLTPNSNSTIAAGTFDVVVVG